ncbi:flagellar protein FlaG [Psychromonas sp. MME2]|uniref:flagellar protein FlaG n=1 Tax=unclassified Psychromonas TaxID=2614957 RepID=UPI00339BBE91
MSELTVTASASRLVPLEGDNITAKARNNAIEVGINEEQEGLVSPLQESEKVTENLSSKEAESAIAEINAFVQSMQRNLSFQVDEDLGESIISVKDMETDELIRQIPSEELVVLRKKMDDVAGILFDTKV